MLRPYVPHGTKWIGEGEGEVIVILYSLVLSLQRSRFRGLVKRLHGRLPRLQAVPFWIVKRSREKAEREKTGYFSSLQSRCAVSAPSRQTRRGLLAVYFMGGYPPINDGASEYHGIEIKFVSGEL